MYVQNLTIGLEHINQKKWAIPHCVLESYIISASWVRRDEPSLFIWSILWEHGEAVRGQQPLLLLKLTLQVGLMLNICHPFCSCDRNTAATIMMTFNCGLADNTLRCIVRPLWSATHWHLPCLLTHTHTHTHTHTLSLQNHCLVKSANTFIRRRCVTPQTSPITSAAAVTAA